MTKIQVDSVTGEYAFVAAFKNDLLLTVKKEGYAFESKYVSASDTVHTEPVKKDIIIQKIEVGKQYTINDIRFATNSYEINDTIKNVLGAFVEYLTQNPRLHVALQMFNSMSQQTRTSTLQPSLMMALVFVVEIHEKLAGTVNIGAATAKVGLDGAWAGASKAGGPY